MSLSEFAAKLMSDAIAGRDLSHERFLEFIKLWSESGEDHKYVDEIVALAHNPDSTAYECSLISDLMGEEI